MSNSRSANRSLDMMTQGFFFPLSPRCPSTWLNQLAGAERPIGRASPRSKSEHDKVADPPIYLSISIDITARLQGPGPGPR
jgi:hypothetical protein